MPDPTDTPTPAPLSPEREQEIRKRHATRTAAMTEWLNQNSPFDGVDILQNAEAVLEEDVPALLAELDRTRTELAKYVGHEPTLTEEALYAHEEKARERIAADLVAWCPDHGSRDTSFMGCHCPAADEVRGSTNAHPTTAGGTS